MGGIMKLGLKLSFFVSLVITIIAFQNCQGHNFAASNTTNQSLDDISGIPLVHIDEGTAADEVNGELTSMTDMGVVRGHAIDPDNRNEPINISFYVINDGGGKDFVGSTVANDPVDDGGGQVLHYNFNIEIPTTHVCKPIVAYAKDPSNDDLIQLPVHKNFMLWGANGDPNSACQFTTPPPYVEIVIPAANQIEVHERPVNLLGRCRIGSGPVSARGDIIETTESVCTDDGLFEIQVRVKHSGGWNHVIVRQQGGNGLVAEDDIRIYLHDHEPPIITIINLNIHSENKVNFDIECEAGLNTQIFLDNQLVQTVMCGPTPIPVTNLVLPMPIGVKIIRVVQVDKAGNEGVSITTVKLDPSPPTCTITSPSNGSTSTNGVITLAGNCTSGIGVKIFVNNEHKSTAQCSGNRFSSQVLLPGGNGSKTVKINQQNVYDLTCHHSISVNKEIPPPQPPGGGDGGYN